MKISHRNAFLFLDLLRDKFLIKALNSVHFSSNMSAFGSKFKFVWIDMEMTGLHADKDKILEVACFVSDTKLTETVEGPHLVIHQPDEILNSMDEWCINQHTKTGLVEESKKSKITEADAEKLLFDFVSKHVTYKKGIIAGNTVHMDKTFLAKYLPKVDEYLHYRIIDVSSVKELCRSWYPQVCESAPTKVNCHRAKEDIKASIDELRFYKATIFK